MNLQEYLLTCLGEEGCEISHQASKTNRFGLTDVNVLEPNGPDNKTRIVAEINDLYAITNLLAILGILPRDWFSPDQQRLKLCKLWRYARYAIQKGSLEILTGEAGLMLSDFGKLAEDAWNNLPRDIQILNTELNPAKPCLPQTDSKVAQ